MKVSIQLFSHVDDAWEDNLRAWLEAGTRAALSGQRVWLVCRSFLQANWLRRRSMEERGTIMGIRFLDIRRLRRELCLGAGLPTPSFGRETLSLLLRARMNESEASSAFAGQVLDALDDLAACGWLERFGCAAALNLLDIPPELRESVAQIVGSLLWRPRVDRALAEKDIKIPGLHVGFFALDARSLNQQELLGAAVNASDEASFWLAQPFVSEAIFMRWVERLESSLGGVVTVTPSEGLPRVYEDLAGKFLYASGPPATLPRLVRAERWSDQTRAVLSIVRSEFASGSRNVAVMVPDGSPTGPAVVEALTAAGINVADEVRSRTLSGHSDRVLRYLADWIGEPRTPEKLLEFFRLLARGPETFARFRGYLFDRFDCRQTRSLAELLPSDSIYPWLPDLLAIGSDWSAAGTWKQLEANWQTTLSGFEKFLARNQNVFRPVSISLEPLQPNWDEIQNALGDLRLSSKIFLRFIADSLSNSGRASHPEASHRYAPVVVSTPEQLHATSWDSVILTDGVSDHWTKASSRDSLLGQEFRRSARQQDLLLVSPPEESLLREDSILQLLMHARRSAIICFYGSEEDGEEVDANRIITFLQRLPSARVEALAPAPAPQANKFGRLKEIRKSRCNPERAFDEYLLNLSSLELSPRAWSASGLQAVIAAPGSFAFQVVLGLERSWDLGFERNEHKMLGTVVHRLLASILRNPFGELFRNGLSDLRENPSLREGRPHLGKQVRELDFPKDDLWWSSIIAKATFFAERMLGQISPWLASFPFGASELSTGHLTIDDPQIALKGRFDLVLANSDALPGADIAIVDFKTAGSPRRINADTGEGFQFVAYRLLAEKLGANCGHQIVVFPVGSKDLQEIREPDTVEKKLAELAWMQRQSCFGHAPLLSGEFGIREHLPIATLAIPAWILRRKRGLTLREHSVG